MFPVLVVYVTQKILEFVMENSREIPSDNP